MKKEYEQLLEKISHITPIQYWHTKDGRSIPIHELKTDHLINILHLIQKKAMKQALTVTSYTWAWRSHLHPSMVDLFCALETEALKRGLSDWELTVKLSTEEYIEQVAIDSEI